MALHAGKELISLGKGVLYFYGQPIFLDFHVALLTLYSYSS